MSPVDVAAELVRLRTEPAATQAELDVLREQLAERDHSPRFATIDPVLEDRFRSAEAEARRRLPPSSCSSLQFRM